MFHAWKLGVFHQRTDEWVKFEGPPPEDFTHQLQADSLQTEEKNLFQRATLIGGSMRERPNNAAPPTA
jgi:hypothetical protein